MWTIVSNVRVASIGGSGGMLPLDSDALLGKKWNFCSF